MLQLFSIQRIEKSNQLSTSNVLEVLLIALKMQNSSRNTTTKATMMDMAPGKMPDTTMATETVKSMVTKRGTTLAMQMGKKNKSVAI